ncbi:AAA family ATPase [Tepidicaulis sp.]|uniref:AAA family ATPase n=1 Tax=Tepidicaulis sp. TaxID=1920809 RepID=UPI003B5910AE
MKPLDCSPHALPFTSFQEAASVLGLTTIRQVLDRPYRRDLIENLLSETGMSVLYGAGGVGKSGLLLEVAISIAAGTDTLNRRTMSGFTVFVHTEGASGLKPRLQAVSLAKGIEIEDLPLVFIEEPVNMRNTESVDNLARKIRELENRSGIKCRLLIIDTLARCFYGDENRQPEMVEFVDNMSRIVRECQAHGLVVHHSGKDGNGPRGSSVLLGAFDTILCLQKGDEPNELILTTDKQKDGAPVAIRIECEQFECGENDEGDTITARAIVGAQDLDQTTAPPPGRGGPSPNARKMLEILKKAGPTGLESAVWRKQAQAAGIGPERPATAREVASRLIKDGLVLQDSATGRCVAT